MSTKSIITGALAVGMLAVLVGMLALRSADDSDGAGQPAPSGSPDVVGPASGSDNDPVSSVLLDVNGRSSVPGIAKGPAPQASTDDSPDSQTRLVNHPRIRCHGEGIPPASFLLRDPEFNVESATFTDEQRGRLQAVIDYENESLVAAATLARDARDQYMERQLQSPSSVVTPGVKRRGPANVGHTKSRFSVQPDGRMEVRTAEARSGDDPGLDAAEETYKSMWKSSTAAVITTYLQIATAK